jgi:Na+-transporting NADH:ubiquinone oxidoreductase subunit NqrB
MVVNKSAKDWDQLTYIALDPAPFLASRASKLQGYIYVVIPRKLVGSWPINVRYFMLNTLYGVLKNTCFISGLLFDHLLGFSTNDFCRKLSWKIIFGVKKNHLIGET